MSLPCLFAPLSRGLVRLDRLLAARWIQAGLFLATLAITWLYGTKIAYASAVWL